MGSSFWETAEDMDVPMEVKLGKAVFSTGIRRILSSMSNSALKRNKRRQIITFGSREEIGLHKLI